MSEAAAHIATRSAVDCAPFDALAESYDREFTERLLGSLLREAVHEEMGGAFRAGDRVLDLGCGTGEDARRLAGHGVSVHAVDRSHEMLRVARAKTHGLPVTLGHADLETLVLPFADGTFDGALANFGALNMVRDLRLAAREVGRTVRLGGRVFVVSMGRWCPWEWAWYVVRGRFATAFRRRRGIADSPAGLVYYPTPAEIAAEFEDEFEHVRTAGIGVLLPPSYAAEFVERHEDVFRRAARLERRIRHSVFGRSFNDHFLIELRRLDRRPRVTYACPSCSAPLTTNDDGGKLQCAAEEVAYERRDGILHLLPEERAADFDRFVAEYDEIRGAEGRGSDAASYYRRLPFVDETGRYTRDWKIRAVSYRSLLRNVVEPLEHSKRQMRIVDLGAGCGWLSYRLARRGHEVCAVDLRTDRRDGLGAHVHYDVPFTPIRAEFDHLPFSTGTVDLVVFNASFHYSENYERTLGEALRVLTENGRIAIVDTPVYRRSLSGSWMVAARERAFKERYGFASNSISSEHFLTPGRLRVLAAETGVTWTIHEPFYGLRWKLRPLRARLRSGCEPAQFGVIVGRPRLDVERELRAARPNPLVRSTVRAAHRIRRRLTAPPPRARTVEVAGLTLDVAPNVFDPLRFRSGAFLADVVRRLDLDDRSVLDVGTGSGVCAIVAALWGARVTATDVSPQATACARRNAERYAVDIEFREADLFDGLAGRRFDVILFNPPYFRGDPADEADRAWRSPDIPERFARDLAGILSRSGYALVVLSTDGACPDYLRTLDRAGYRLGRVARRRFGNETLTVYRIGGGHLRPVPPHVSRP